MTNKKKKKTDSHRNTIFMFSKLINGKLLRNIVNYLKKKIFLKKINLTFREKINIFKT